MTLETQSPKQQLRQAIRMVEWGANIRIEQKWQIELLKEIIVGERKEGAARQESNSSRGNNTSQ